MDAVLVIGRAHDVVAVLVRLHHDGAAHIAVQELCVRNGGAGARVVDQRVM